MGEITCQVCGDVCEDGAAVACAACGTLHHQECWEWVGRCSTFGCGGRETVAARHQVVHIELPASLAEGAARPDAPVVTNRSVSLEGPHLRLDLETPLESSLTWGAWLSGGVTAMALATTLAAGGALPGAPLAVLAFPMALMVPVVAYSLPTIRRTQGHRSLPVMVLSTLLYLWVVLQLLFVMGSAGGIHSGGGIPAWLVATLAGSLLLTGMLFVLGRETDCSYFLHHEERVLEYRRRVLWWVQHQVRCPYENVMNVAIRDKPGPVLPTGRSEGGVTLYEVALILRDGEIILVSDHMVRVDDAEVLARQLADHVGAPVARLDAPRIGP